MGEYFRLIWFEDGVFYKPYNIRPLPNFTFPDNAPVEVYLEFELTGKRGGIEQIIPSNDGGAWNFRVPNLRPNDDLARSIEERFDVYYESTVTSALKVTKLKKEKVLLRWLRNQKPPPMRERRLPRR